MLVRPEIFCKLLLEPSLALGKESGLSLPRLPEMLKGSCCSKLPPSHSFSLNGMRNREGDKMEATGTHRRW